MNIGDVFSSSAGKLKCKKVYHAVGPEWKGGKKNEEKDLKNAITTCFKMANKDGLKTISLPAVSSGVYGFPKDKCAEILFQCAVEHFDNEKDSSLEQIRFVNFDDETVSYFESEFENRFGDEDKKNKKNDKKDEKKDDKKLDVFDDIDEEIVEKFDVKKEKKK